MTWGETGVFGRNLPCASADDDMTCCGVLCYCVVWNIVMCSFVWLFLILFVFVCFCVLYCTLSHFVVIVAVDVVGAVQSGVGEVQCAVSFCVLACRIVC